MFDRMVGVPPMHAWHAYMYPAGAHNLSRHMSSSTFNTYKTSGAAISPAICSLTFCLIYQGKSC